MMKATNTVTQEQIDEIWAKADKQVYTIFDKCTVMAVRLANGFILVETSASVDPINYSEKVGREICTARLKDKLWELEGYRLQCALKGE